MALLLLFPLFLILFSLPPALPQPRAELVSRTCNETHHSDISAHLENLSWSLDVVRQQISVEGYGFASRGTPPARTFVMAQCHDDLSSDDCWQCFTQAEALLRACFPSIGGRVYLDGCFLRAENYSFYTQVSSPEDTQVCGLSDSPYRDFPIVTRRLITKMIESASKDRFSRGVEYSTNVAVYALANCWNSLDQRSCVLCLQQAWGESFCLLACCRWTLPQDWLLFPLLCFQVLQPRRPSDKQTDNRDGRHLRHYHNYHVCGCCLFWDMFGESCLQTH